LTTKLRLLLDEQVPQQLAGALQRPSRLDVVCVRDTAVSGKDDQAVINYARNERRIVVTTDLGISENSFPVCTHPGIIILRSRQQHVAIRGKVFQRFIRSGHRKHAKDAVTRLRHDEAFVKSHQGESVYRF